MRKISIEQAVALAHFLFDELEKEANTLNPMSVPAGKPPKPMAMAPMQANPQGPTFTTAGAGPKGSTGPAAGVISQTGLSKNLGQAGAPIKVKSNIPNASIGSGQNAMKSLIGSTKPVSMAENTSYSMAPGTRRGPISTTGMSPLR